MSSKIHPRQRRIAVCGFRGVGKSTLIIQLVEGRFVEDYHPTIENTFHKTISYQGREYQTDIVDTAGQDESSLFPTNCSVGVHGYILVYSITSTSSFETLKTIHDKILDRIGSNSVPVVLVGNKTDLFNERRVEITEGQKLADEWGCAFTESSAKSNPKVTEIFLQLIAEIERGSGNVEPPKKEGCVIL